MRSYEAMWEAAGGRVSASVGSASAVAVLGDDPSATAAVALGIARAHARSRRVYLFDLIGGELSDVPSTRTDEDPGVSDMVHYGVSLRRAARSHAAARHLFVVPGGAETPLSEGILTDRWWGMIVDQIRRADALLLVAAPSMVPGMREMASQLDGVLLVGDAAPPTPFLTVLAEVRSAAALRPQGTPTGAHRTVEGPLRRSRWPWVAAALVAILAGAVTAPRWLPYVGLGNVRDPGAAASLPPIPPPLTSQIPASGNEASYSVELLFTNSTEDALAYLGPSSDTLPAATFSIVSMGPESDRWFRLVAGAFADSVAAGDFLQRLRGRGSLATGAGAIARTPFALLLDSASSDAIAQLRVSAYKGRGIPAYALRDSAAVWRVYAGAFATEGDGQLLKEHLDSLNIQSALVTRAGSTS